MDWLGFCLGGTCLACRARLPLGSRDAFCAACSPGVLPAGRWHEVTTAGGPLPVAGAWAYGGPLALAVREIKEHGRLPDLRGVVPALRALLDEAVDRAPCTLVAVPPQGDRLRERGLHLPDLLVGSLAAPNRRPRLALRRLDREPVRRLERNAAPRFAARPAPGEAPAIVLVDDVVTSGQTLAAAADALTAAGWPVLAAVCLADARPGTLAAALDVA